MIGVVGCGGIVRSAHLPAYRRHGLAVAGVYDPSPEALAGIPEPAYESVEALLDDPRVEFVDVATHVDVRAPLVRRALEAGKHVLSQKPFAATLAEARALVDLADARGVRLAVNQNGRFSPAWSAATRWLREGRIGAPQSVVHLFETSFGFVPGTPFDAMPAWVVWDYAIHWVDITMHWMGSDPVAVDASLIRYPAQTEGREAWGCAIEFRWSDGRAAHLRSVAPAATRVPGHPFWIHGERGTIRGSVLGRDRAILDADGRFERARLSGAWFPDAFAGTMRELIAAVRENREPTHSGRDNLRTLEWTLRARESALGGELPPG